MHPTKAIINLSNLDHNIKELKKNISQQTSLMAVVKANAYGHGAVEVAKQALESGASWLGVATPDEGAELREAGVSAPIIVLSGIDSSQVQTVVRYGLTQTVFNKDILHSLNDSASQNGKVVNVHIKLDTGMRRIGVSCPKELEKLLKELKLLSNVRLDGAFTHFASADEADKTFTYLQLNCFFEFLEIFKNQNAMPQWLHAANSAAILDCPETHFNLVRAGISIYGYHPSTEKPKTNVLLLPVMQLVTKILCIKNINQGDSIGYGRTFYAEKPMKTATLPIGYADGYKRILSNKGYVLISGMKAPVVGRVCMDQMMVDVTNIPSAKPGDEVVLIGTQQNSQIDADELANLCDTISYEILTSIHSRVRRFYI